MIPRFSKPVVAAHPSVLGVFDDPYVVSPSVLVIESMLNASSIPGNNPSNQIVCIFVVSESENPTMAVFAPSIELSFALIFIICTALCTSCIRREDVRSVDATVVDASTVFPFSIEMNKRIYEEEYMT